jgi:hypothetical protein
LRLPPGLRQPVETMTREVSGIILITAIVIPVTVTNILAQVTAGRRIMSRIGEKCAKRPPVARFAKGRSSGWAFFAVELGGSHGIS